MPPFDFIYKATSSASGDLLPTTVLFGNSFSDMYFSVGIQTYFNEFDRARNIAPRFDLSLRDLPPGTKYVVYQYFAPFLITDIDGWQLSDLTRQKQRSSCLPAHAASPPAAGGAGCRADLQPKADR